MIDTPGIYDVPAADYHADDGICPAPSLSSSGARKLLNTCPARYWYERTHPPEPSAAFDFGSAAHEWLLEGDDWPQRVGVLPPDHNGRTKEGKAAVEEIIAAGKRPLKAEDFDTIKQMKDALDAHPFAAAAFRGGRAERSVYWQDDATGVWCRARPDYLPDHGSILVDYKTCQSAEPEELKRAIARYGYHIQAAWYCAGVEAVGHIKQPAFAFVFQEKTAPYLITVATLDSTALQWGQILSRHAMNLFAAGLQTNEWPGYAADVVSLGLPAWEEKRLQAEHEAGVYELAHAPLTNEE